MGILLGLHQCIAILAIWQLVPQISRHAVDSSAPQCRLPESAPAGSEVVSLRSVFEDTDAAEFRLLTFDRRFRIDTGTHRLLYVGGRLDFESEPVMWLTLQARVPRQPDPLRERFLSEARDSGVREPALERLRFESRTLGLIVRITDAPEPPLVRPDQSLLVRDSAGSPSPHLGRVMAVDEDGDRLQFSLRPSDLSRGLLIDPESGELRLRADSPLRQSPGVHGPMRWPVGVRVADSRGMSTREFIWVVIPAGTDRGSAPVPVPSPRVASEQPPRTAVRPPSSTMGARDASTPDRGASAKASSSVAATVSAVPLDVPRLSDDSDPSTGAAVAANSPRMKVPSEPPHSPTPEARVASAPIPLWPVTTFAVCVLAVFLMLSWISRRIQASRLAFVSAAEADGRSTAVHADRSSGNSVSVEAAFRGAGTTAHTASGEGAGRALSHDRPVAAMGPDDPRFNQFMREMVASVSGADDPSARTSSRSAGTASGGDKPDEVADWLHRMLGKAPAAATVSSSADLTGAGPPSRPPSVAEWMEPMVATVERQAPLRDSVTLDDPAQIERLRAVANRAARASLMTARRKRFKERWLSVGVTATACLITGVASMITGCFGTVSSALGMALTTVGVALMAQHLLRWDALRLTPRAASAVNPNGADRLAVSIAPRDSAARGPNDVQASLHETHI